ncbi:hypothetical protein EON81_03840 [bacterium]|nr:MAG: hypothetical protein EON81_03840 [bacterium]
MLKRSVGMGAITLVVWGCGGDSPSFRSAVGWLLSYGGDPVFHYQAAPFDASLASPDYQDAVDPADNSIFKTLPSASISSLTLACESGFQTTGRICGPVRFNIDVARTCTKMYSQYTVGAGPSITVATGGTQAVAEGNRAVVLLLNKCKPGGGIQGQ